MFLPQGIFSTEYHLLKQKQIHSWSLWICDWNTQRFVLSVIPLVLMPEKNMFVLNCELKGHYQPLSAEFVELSLIGWWIFCGSTTSQMWIIYLTSLCYNSYQCYNKICICILWYMLMFLWVFFLFCFFLLFMSCQSTNIT